MNHCETSRNSQCCRSPQDQPADKKNTKMGSLLLTRARFVAATIRFSFTCRPWQRWRLSWTGDLLSNPYRPRVGDVATEKLLASPATKFFVTIWATVTRKLITELHLSQKVSNAPIFDLFKLHASGRLQRGIHRRGGIRTVPTRG